MMESRSFKFLSAMTCGTPQPRAEDDETLANHVGTRLNDTRIAKSQAPDNRAELQGKNESPEKVNAQNFSGGAGGGPRAFHPKGTKCCAHRQYEGLPIRAVDGEQG